jgi:glycosyltransferase involved in cell wall biosynthesis
MTPRISVIISTYNYGRFVEDAIDSALAQDFPAGQMEILVVDDGSTDDTAERVKKYGNRIRYFYKENGDHASAATFGFAHAKGDLIALLDGDDVWLPQKLSRVAEEFARDSRTTMVFHKYVFWDHRDNTTWEPEYFGGVSGDVLRDRRKVVSYNAAPTSSLVFRRNAFQRLSNIPLDRHFNYDTYLMVAVLFLGPVGYVPELLTKNRVHGSNRWAADKNGPDQQTLRRRAARLGAAIEVLRDWIRANAPESRSQARTILRRYELVNESELFKLNPPGRFRFFRHLVEMNWNALPAMTWRHVAVSCINTCGALFTGYRHYYLLDQWRLQIKRAVVGGSRPVDEKSPPADAKTHPSPTQGRA